MLHCAAHFLYPSHFSLEQSSDSKKDSKRTSSEWNGIDSLMVVLPFEGWLQKNKCSTALRTFYTLPFFSLEQSSDSKKDSKRTSSELNGIDSLMVVLPFEGWLQKNKCCAALRTFYTLSFFHLSKAQIQKEGHKKRLSVNRKPFIFLAESEGFEPTDP